MYDRRNYRSNRTRYVNLIGGAIVNDGTAQFSVKTVCAKEYVDAVNATVHEMKEKYIFRFEIIPKADITRDAVKPACIYVNSPVPKGYERLTVNCTTGGGYAVSFAPDLTDNTSKINSKLALWAQGYVYDYNIVWDEIINISIFTIFVKKEG